MFPSRGYFSSFPCPFYVNGLCERPYCHFRHSKHDVEKAKEEAPCHAAEDTSNSTTTSTSQCSSTVDSILSSPAANPELAPIVAEDVYFTSASEEKTLPPPPTLSQEPETDSFSIPSFTDNSSKYQVPIAEEPEQYVTASPEKTQPATGPPVLPTYLPTPKTPSLPAPEPGDFGVPVYQPTPKRELKRRHGDHVKGKAKGANIEYDPECNYSCGGLTNSSHEPTERKDDQEYQPTKKKARRSMDLSSRRKGRLSCDSLMTSSPDLLSESGDDLPEAQFSEEECDGAETAGKAKDDSMGEESETFENIGDDDISSDDEFIDVPEVQLSKTNMKNEKKAKASPSSSEKTTKASSGKKPDPLTSSHNSLAKQQQKQTSKDSSSKSSGSKQSSSSSSKESVASKADKSSSRNGTTSGKVVKQDGSKPSSSSAKSSSISKSHSGDKTHQSATQSSTKLSSKQKKELDSKVKEHKSESAQSSESLEKRPKSSSSSLSSNKHSSSSMKSPLSDTKSSSSKHTVSKSDAVRRSSLDSQTSDSRHSFSTSKEGSQSNSVGRQSSSHSNISRKHSNSESKSGSQKHSSLDMKGDARSVADSPSASSSSGSRHTSSSGKSTKTSNHGSHSKSSESNGKSSIIKNTSTEKSSSYASKKSDSEKTSKDQKLQRRHSSSSSTSKHTGSHEKAQKPTSSSHDKKSSPKKSNSNSKDSSRKRIERMNSNLFGDDSDADNEDCSFSGNICDNSGESSFEEPSTSKAAEEEMDVDYSNFIHDSDFEEEDTFDECLRIFKEEAPKKRTSNPEKRLVKDLKAESSSQHGPLADIPGKKRTAHKLAEKVRKPELLRKERPRKILSATEVMHNRIMEMQRRALEKAANQVLQEQEVSSTSGSASKSRPGLGVGGEKKRVAHTPKPPPPAPKPKSFSVKSDGKGILNKVGSEPEKRMAHTPNLVNLKRPVIPASFGSKVPSNIRQRYLNLIIDECLKFCPDQEQAFKKGLEEETGVYDRASNKNIYLRVAVNAITRLRAEAKEAMPGSSKSQQSRSSLTQSHEATIGGSRAAKTSFTLHRSNSSGKKIEVPLTAVELYQKLMKYTMTEEQLKDNGYPLPSPDTPGKAMVTGSRYQATDTLLKANERNCARCGTRFIVKEDGEYAYLEDCVYHWSRAYPRKKSGFIQHIYNCCGSDTSSKGCQVAASHVHDRNKQDSLTGFMRTMPRSPPRDGNFGIYALDCEMVYSLGGLELARVTVIDVEGETVYESLVQPFSSIVDYNTRFSGLKAADLKDIKTTLTDVQAILLSLFSDKTILIGHSLESDLFALKLIHKTVVDTSVVFPHRLGPPYKRALKNLMLETFQKIIQGDDGGHDSKEDAVACLQLMKWRLKEDSRREQRYS